LGFSSYLLFRQYDGFIGVGRSRYVSIGGGDGFPPRIHRSTAVVIDDRRYYVSFIRYTTVDVPLVLRLVPIPLGSSHIDECFLQRAVAPFIHLGFDEVAFADRIERRGEVVEVGLGLGIPPAYETVFRFFGTRIHAKVYRVGDLPRPEEIRVLKSLDELKEVVRVGRRGK